jgi:protease-4
MAAALEKLAAAKPLIAAMGPVAASGGYYVCTPAQWISAQPSTLTGSIGVLAGKFVTGALWDKLLFRRESIYRGQQADFDSGERPYSDEERQSLTEDIHRVYDVFLDRVMASRRMSRDEVDAVAGGRVWTGRQAQERGLVDHLGGLEDALAKARQEAGLHPRAPVYEIPVSREHSLPPLPDPVSMLGYSVENLTMLGGGAPLCLCDPLPLEVHNGA